jgi:hypothetical protein
MAKAPEAPKAPPIAPKAPAAPVAAKAAKAETTKRIAPELTTITSEVELPKKVSKRGSKSLYPFEKLEVGQSFGVTNKTAAGMASIISNQNRKHRAEKQDENGNTVFEMKDLKGADGTVTQVPTDKPVMNVDKHFFASNCDPKKDPDGASVRVFRDK